MFKAQTNQGFTLLELLIVVAIMSILITFLIPNLAQARAKANDSSTQAYIRHCLNAVEISRDPVTGNLPSGLDGANCNSSLLGNSAVVDISSVVPGSSVINVDSSQLATVQAQSVTGTTFEFDGSRLITVP